MKYSILINQLAVVQNGLHNDTDLIDWALMDYIQQWITHPKAQKLGDKVWINYKHIITEMPLIGLKAKSSISNRITKLESIGLIETEKDDSFRLFVKITHKAHQVITFHEDSQGVIPVPNEERGVHSQERGVPNEERGVPEKVHSTNNQALNHQEQTIKVKNRLLEIETPDNLNLSAWQNWINYKQQIKKPYKTEQGIKTAMNQLAELSHDQQEACINSSIANEYQGFFVENFKGNKHAKRESSFEREEREHQKYLQERERLVGNNEEQIPFALGRTDGIKLL